MYLYEVAERKQGARVGMRLWEQAGIDMTGAMETAEAAVEDDKDGLE